MTDRWRALQDADPEFFEAFAEPAAVPRRSSVLDPKAKELVSLAVNTVLGELEA